MDSPFANHFNATIARIQSAAPSIKWQDQEFGQLEFYTTRPAVLFPCTLLDYDEWVFSETSKGVQQGNGFLTVRLAFEPFTNTSGNVPLPRREVGMQFWELEREVFIALHGWSDGVFTRLLRRSTETEKRKDNLRVRAMRFETSLIDASAVPEMQKIARPTPLVFPTKPIDQTITG